jgi:cyclase
MLAKRIIPCLDIKDGQTVKGIQFEDLRQAGDPVQLAQRYAQMGADELVFLDITATHEQRDTLLSLVERVAQCLNIPFTVGGGIRSLADAHRLLRHGADKISINSAAVRQPELIAELAQQFGSQCVVLAIDAKRHDDGQWYVYLNGGRVPTPLKALDWALQGQALGAGEILLTSMNHDGMQSGFALEITDLLAQRLNIPVIASGGAGKAEHFVQLFQETAADAALAAGIFHFGQVEIPTLKQHLAKAGVPVRLEGIAKI